MRKPQHAYSFIEMLTVLVIIAIVASLSLPSFNEFWQRDHDAEIKLQVLNALQLAREAAQINSTSVAVCKSTDLIHCGGQWREGVLIFVNAAEDGVLNNKNQLIAAIAFPKATGQLLWRAFPFYRDYLLFSAIDTSNVNNGTFWYCRQQATTPRFAIIVNQSYRARVEYPDKNGVILDGRGKALVC